MEFQGKVLNRQKELWAALVVDSVEESERDFKKAETHVEKLKDASALRSMAEYLM